MEVDNNKRHNNHSGLTGSRPAGIRLLLAIGIGKAVIALTRILGRGGTTLPGRTALAISPNLSSQLASRLKLGTIAVTGTNGKTTTASLIDAILEKAGLNCIHNQSGSNMSWGVASTLIENSSWTGRMDGDLAVMEIDEGAFPGVTASLRPRGAVVTNIFRDQLDRFGEIDSIQSLVKKGLNILPPGSFQVINADDPSLGALESVNKYKRWTYGLELELPSGEFQNTGRDIKTCPNCSRKLDYSRIYFAHLGHYRCPSCSFSRPEPDIKLTRHTVNAEGTSRIQISLPGRKLDLDISLLGVYNLYNVLAAVTCAYALDISTAIIKAALETAAPSFGRMERFVKDDKEMIMALIKNPVGANEVLRTILSQPGEINLLIAINDKIADGKDVSWLWDVDFEQLSKLNSSFPIIIASGLRAREMALRLKYAGYEPERLRIETDPGQAIELALKQTAPGSKLFILPTYTAMLEMRQHLNKMGLGAPFWEDL